MIASVLGDFNLKQSYNILELTLAPITFILQKGNKVCYITISLESNKNILGAGDEHTGYVALLKVIHFLRMVS